MPMYAAVSYLPAPRHAGIALAAMVAMLFACGEDKAPDKSENTEKPYDAQVKPATKKPTSATAQRCEKHGAANKANCLCRADAMRTQLGDELLSKFETAPSSSTDAVVKHVGGLANLSKIYDAMRKATEQCAIGAAK